MDELKKQLESWLEESKEILSYVRAEKSKDHELLIKLDSRLSEVLKRMSDMLEDHETRMRQIELNYANDKGVVKGWAVASSLIGGAIGSMVHFFFGK